jgi:hypothetical protein
MVLARHEGGWIMDSDWVPEVPARRSLDVIGRPWISVPLRLVVQGHVSLRLSGSHQPKSQPC